ncbi:MAG: hypothetical protein NTV22_02615 [bacterium]|nr:hypothetical protein [bacterium]
MAPILWLFGGWVSLACVAVLLVGQAGLSIIDRPIYREFKALSVEGDDQELAIEYLWYVKQWKGCHVLLKPPKKL